MDKFSTIILLAFISGCLSQSDDEDTITDYAKLTLNHKALLGSRWALEHQYGHSTVTVFHAFDIVDMAKVDLEGMKIRVDFNVRQRWEAESLILPEGLFKPDDKDDANVIAEEDVLNSVWSPDSFIPNARETHIHSVAAQQSVVAIYKNRSIIYKARMHSHLGCSFTFEWYPLDMQTCDLVFESYEVVDYQWEPGVPVTSAPDIVLYQYELVLPPKISTGTHKRWAGRFKYPYVKITFKFERKLGNNILQVFVPTILVVILSCFSFWLGLDAVPGRISLLITCILTLVTMHSSLKGAIPPVHYIKMMDIWILGCMTFVFGAMCEFVVVKYLKWRAMQREKAKADLEASIKNSGQSMNFAHPQPPSNGKALYPADYNQFVKQSFSYGGKPCQPLSHSAQQRRAWEKQIFVSRSSPPELNQGLTDDYARLIQMQAMMAALGPSAAPRAPSRPIWVTIDMVCRAVFPILFAVFNAAYWPILLIGSARQYEDHDKKA